MSFTSRHIISCYDYCPCAKIILSTYRENLLVESLDVNFCSPLTIISVQTGLHLECPLCNVLSS